MDDLKLINTESLLRLLNRLPDVESFQGNYFYAGVICEDEKGPGDTMTLKELKFKNINNSKWCLEI